MVNVYVAVLLKKVVNPKAELRYFYYYFILPPEREEYAAVLNLDAV